MVRERFGSAFDDARRQSNRRAGVERTAENFDERTELDRLRAEVMAARDEVVSRSEPPAPDVVEPRRRSTNTKLWAKVAAAVSVVLLALAVLFIMQIARTATDQFPLEITRAVESIDTSSQGCAWTVDLTVRNGSDETIQIERVEAILNQAVQRGTSPRLLSILPGESAPLALTWNQLGTSLDCPASVDAIDHANIIIGLDNGEAVSLPLPSS